ncbi:response regulator [Clostridiaceae bacterium 35-E11]
MKKILIVEDEKNIVLSLKMYLKKEGYDIKVARNGIDALKAVQEDIPDLILLDILMPNMNGYLVCEALKDDMETKHIPVIFMSAKSQEKDLNKAFEVGGSDYIIKPFTHEEIKKLINKYI